MNDEVLEENVVRVGGGGTKVKVSTKTVPQQFLKRQAMFFFSSPYAHLPRAYVGTHTCWLEQYSCIPVELRKSSWSPPLREEGDQI